MSKHSKDSGSWNSKDDGNSGMFGHVGTNKTSGQHNYYVGKEGSDSHCHAWNNTKTGESGVVHRGDCKVCQDEAGSGGK